MNAAGHQLLLNCLETLQRALKGGDVNLKDWCTTQRRAIFSAIPDMFKIFPFVSFSLIFALHDRSSGIHCSAKHVSCPPLCSWFQPWSLTNVKKNNNWKKRKSAQDEELKISLLVLLNRLRSHLSPSGTECYITSDMFYVEVQLDSSGQLVDVKVAHQGENPTVSNFSEAP